MFFELEKKLDFTNKNNVEGPFQWKRVSNCLEVAVMCEKEKAYLFQRYITICVLLLGQPTYYLDMDMLQLHHCIYKVSFQVFRRLETNLGHPF